MQKKLDSIVAILHKVNPVNAVEVGYLQ